MSDLNDQTGSEGGDEEPTLLEELLERVDRAHFSPARFREGYDTTQVDACLLRLRAALEGDIPLDPIVAESRFTLLGFRDGYDTSLVDLFLLELARDSRELSDGNADLPSPAPARQTDRQGYIPQFAAAPAIIERRGFLRRKRTAD